MSCAVFRNIHREGCRLVLRWSAILLVWLWAIPASAQTPTLTWAHDGVDVTAFTVAMDATRVSLAATARSWTGPILSVGPHTFVVSACNSAECASAPVLTYTVPAPVPPPTPVPAPAPITCKDGSAIFPLGFTEWVYTKVSGSFEGNADYKRLVLAGWAYVDGSAYRQRANYYNLQFRCGR